MRLLLAGNRDDVPLPSDDSNDKADNSKGAYSKFFEGIPHDKNVGATRSNVTLESTGTLNAYAAHKYGVEGNDSEFSFLLCSLTFCFSRGNI